MSDLSPETRRLIEMAREGDPIPSGRRALIESKLFTRVAGGALVGLAARQAWAKSAGLFGPLAKGIAGLAIVSAVGAGGYFAVRTTGSNTGVARSSSVSTQKTAPLAEAMQPMAQAMVAPSPEGKPPASPIAGSIEPARAAAARPQRDATTRRVVASSAAKASGTSSRSTGSGQRAATTAPPAQPAQPAQTAQNTAPPEQPTAQPPEEATPARPTSTLADETRLLWEADQALRSGKTSRAVALLDEHMTRYPEGALGPERGAERVVALCKLGRIDAATVRGYLTSHPNLPLSDRIQQTCAPILSRGK